MRIVPRWLIATAPVLGLMVGISVPAKAVLIVNSTGISNPARTITFSEISLANGASLTNQYSSLGVTFTGLFYDPQPGFPDNHIQPPDIGNFSAPGDPPANLANPFSIYFNQTQTAAAFALATASGTTTFDALLNGIVVDSGTAATGVNFTNNFYGFSGVAFNQIRITVASFNNAALLDNLQLGNAASAVPEPSTLVMAGVATLSGLGVGWRRRKRAIA